MEEFKQLLKLLEPDNIFLPKEIVSRKDITNQSKIMLGIIFTANRFASISQIKTALCDTTDDDIIKEFGDNPQMVKRIKSDINKVIKDFDTLFLTEVNAH